MAPTADAAVPVPEGKPVQEPLIDLPDKPKKPRKLTEEQTQANEWRSKALAIAGIAEADAGPWPSEMFLAWKAQAKRRTVATMMRALDGIARMPATEFVRKRGWTHWLSGEGIDAGLAALAAPSAPTAPRTTVPRPESPPPPPRPKWNITDAAATANGLAKMTKSKGKPRLVIPHGESVPEGFDTSEFEVVHIPAPAPRLQDLIPAGGA